jgi:hypothetical protein
MSKVSKAAECSDLGLPKSDVKRNPVNMHQRFGGVCCFRLQDTTFNSVFSFGDRRSSFYRNIGTYLPNHTASQPRGCYESVVLSCGNNRDVKAAVGSSVF